jgi:CST complex subunit TEN1
MERFGEILLLKELYQCSATDECDSASSEVVGKYVRVTGYIEEYDPLKAQCLVSHGDSRLLVDLKLVFPEHMTVGSLFQFIGELAGVPAPDRLLLKARVAKNVNGMDMKLFEQSLLTRRRFLAVSLLLMLCICVAC